ncbi:ABC transporter transmembrane domain-containing protein [soil metagenome]
MTVIASNSDVRRLLAVFDRFSDSRRPLLAISGLSFLSGMSEAAVLVTITTVAISTTNADGLVALGPIEVEQRPALVLGFVALTANLVVTVLLARTSASTVTDASLRARQQLLTAFHASSYQRKSQDRAAALQEALTTYVDRFTNSLVSLAGAFTALLSLVAFAGAAVVVNPAAFGALAVVGLLLLVVLKPATKRMRAANTALARERKSYAEGATESVLLARELSVFGATHVAGSRLGALDRNVARQFWRAKFLNTLTPKVYQGLVFGLALVALLVITGQAQADLAAIGAVVILVIRSMTYGQQLLSTLQSMSEQRPYVDRLVDMLDSYTDETRTAGAVRVGPIDRFDLRWTSFGYGDSGESNALTDVSISIGAGETLGVVGPSGAGKSTMVNVLLRLYEPTSGEVLVNGVALHDVDDNEWHRRVAIVPQEPRLIHGTIADNIRFLRDLDDESVQQAAVEAHIDGFIRTLPAGYDSPVGELGMGLSGGQRQRICIARALAGKPDLLVLDEPTSALDGESEAAIQRTLQQLKGQVTMVIVAHRLSTLSICDRLLVLEDGRLVASGSADDLAESSPYYREAMRLAGL